MINSITVTNYLGDKLKLELARPERSGFVIKSITGLGAGKANISTSDVITTDGGLFNSSRLPVRNIVISLEFMRLASKVDGQSLSIEEARQKTYRYFPIKRKVTLQIDTDNRSVEIEGYVESNEPTIFSKNEGTEISIICPDPYFYAYGDDGVISTDFYGLTPLFEFPFSNESTSIPLMEMGTLSETSQRTVMYEGDIETGVTITLHATGEANNITIHHHNPDTTGSIRIDTDKLRALTGSSIKAGDDIIICTIKGSKFAKLVRDGKTRLILNCLDKDAAWFQLVRGENVFTYTADDDGASKINMSIEGRVRYEGV